MKALTTPEAGLDDGGDGGAGGDGDTAGPDAGVGPGAAAFEQRRPVAGVESESNCMQTTCCMRLANGDTAYHCHGR